MAHHRTAAVVHYGQVFEHSSERREWKILVTKSLSKQDFANVVNGTSNLHEHIEFISEGWTLSPLQTWGMCRTPYELLLVRSTVVGEPTTTIIPTAPSSSAYPVIPSSLDDTTSSTSTSTTCGFYRDSIARALSISDRNFCSCGIEKILPLHSFLTRPPSFMSQMTQALQSAPVFGGHAVVYGTEAPSDGGVVVKMLTNLASELSGINEFRILQHIANLRRALFSGDTSTRIVQLQDAFCCTRQELSELADPSRERSRIAKTPNVEAFLSALREVFQSRYFAKETHFVLVLIFQNVLPEMGKIVNPSLARLRRYGVPLSGKMGIFLQMAKGLQELHSLGLIHGDVKPHNLIIKLNWMKPPTVTWIDLGFACPIGARFQNSEFDPQSLNVIQTTIPDHHRPLPSHTTGYSAPEIILGILAQGGCSVSPTLDIWAYGIIVAEWMFGFCFRGLPIHATEKVLAACQDDATEIQKNSALSEMMEDEGKSVIYQYINHSRPDDIVQVPQDRHYRSFRHRPLQYLSSATSPSSSVQPSYCVDETFIASFLKQCCIWGTPPITTADTGSVPDDVSAPTDDVVPAPTIYAPYTTLLQTLPQIPPPRSLREGFIRATIFAGEMTHHPIRDHTIFSAAEAAYDGSARNRSAWNLISRCCAMDPALRLQSFDECVLFNEFLTSEHSI